MTASLQIMLARAWELKPAALTPSSTEHSNQPCEQQISAQWLTVTMKLSENITGHFCPVSTFFGKYSLFCMWQLNRKCLPKHCLSGCINSFILSMIMDKDNCCQQFSELSIYCFHILLPSLLIWQRGASILSSCDRPPLRQYPTCWTGVNHKLLWVVEEDCLLLLCLEQSMFWLF